MQNVLFCDLYKNVTAMLIYMRDLHVNPFYSDISFNLMDSMQFCTTRKYLLQLKVLTPFQCRTVKKYRLHSLSKCMKYV
jgi:hypothetical protein